MVRRARKFGGPDENDIWNVLFWALIGAIVGARVGYIVGHLSQVTDGGSDLLGIFKVWEGGISLIGGITGAVLFGMPYMFRRGMGFWRTMDLAAPGLALGIVIGRIGDLVIGDHLGKPTDFALGWRCLGSEGDAPTSATAYLDALNAGNPPSLGCFDLVLHQTALYDFFSTLALLAVLLWLGRQPASLRAPAETWVDIKAQAHKPGFMIIVFTCWYGAMRVITDFLRVDRRYLGLTGSQLMSLTVGLACLYLLARYRGAPPGWRREGAPPGAPDDGPTSGTPVPAPVPAGAPATESDLEDDFRAESGGPGNSP